MEYRLREEAELLRIILEDSPNLFSEEITPEDYKSITLAGREEIRFNAEKGTDSITG